MRCPFLGGNGGDSMSKCYKISLADLRKKYRLSIRQASDYLEITEKNMIIYESNPGIIPASVLFKIRLLYKVPLDLIKLN